MSRSILFACSLIALTGASGPSIADSSEALPLVEVTSTDPAALGDSGLTVVLIDITDQRCPAGVECYWEGMIRVELRVETPGAPAQTVVLCNLCDDATRDAKVGEVTLTLMGLAPTTEALAGLGRAATLSDYTVSLAYLAL